METSNSLALRALEAWNFANGSPFVASRLEAIVGLAADVARDVVDPNDSAEFEFGLRASLRAKRPELGEERTESLALLLARLATGKVDEGSFLPALEAFNERFRAGFTADSLEGLDEYALDGLPKTGPGGRGEVVRASTAEVRDGLVETYEDEVGASPERADSLARLLVALVEAYEDYGVTVERTSSAPDAPIALRFPSGEALEVSRFPLPGRAEFVSVARTPLSSERVYALEGRGPALRVAKELGAFVVRTKDSSGPISGFVESADFVLARVE